MTSTLDRASLAESAADRLADAAIKSAIDPATASRASVESPRAPEQRPQEHGGRIGPEPTRYGDWEKGGRCIDF